MSVAKKMLGKRKAPEADVQIADSSSDDASSSSTIEDSALKNEKSEEQESSDDSDSSSDSETDSDSDSDSDDEHDDSVDEEGDTTEKDDAETFDENMPDCLTVVDKPRWQRAGSGELQCLLCPEKKITYRKGDPWEFHVNTKAHNRRLKRYRKEVAKVEPHKLPRDPREFVTQIDTKVKAHQATIIPKKLRRKRDPLKVAKTEKKVRERKIRKADKKANREHRKRALKGLPRDPKIDEEALKTKLSLGWVPPPPKPPKEPGEPEEPAEKKPLHVPAWKVYSKVHKAEKQAIKAHKRNTKLKKPFDPTIDEKVENLKALLNYDPAIHKNPKAEANKKKAKAKMERQAARATGRPWEQRGKVGKSQPSFTDSNSAPHSKPAFFMDEFGTGANEIKLDLGAADLRPAKKQKTLKALR